MLRVRDNFSYRKPDFVDGDFKWYLDEHFNKFLSNRQDFNLPPLKGLAVFVVKNSKDDVSDYVLINDRQQVLDNYHYSNEGFEQLEAKIKFRKVAQYYDDNE